MRGVLVRDWKPFDQLQLEEMPPPELGPKHIRISTQAAGMSFATSLVVEGKYQRKPPRPFVPGTEAAGIVTEVGAEVTRFRPGDRVIAPIDWGALSEECTAHQSNAAKIPDSLSFDRAICFTNSYSTSCASLTWRHLLDVQAGETLLVHGAAGGVGLAAIEIGKILGATVIATAGSEEKLRVVREHGADHAINYREGPFREPVLELTDGRGADKIYDPVGGDVFDMSLRCIAPEGRILPVGFASGRIPQIPANILLVKNVTVCGLNYGYYTGWGLVDVREEMEPRTRAVSEQLFAWFEQGRLKPRISHVFPLEKFREAMAVVLCRQSIGRVAVVMGDEAKRHGF